MWFKMKRILCNSDAQILTILFWSTLYLLTLKISVYPNHKSFSVTKIKRSFQIHKYSYNTTMQQDSIIDRTLINNGKEPEKSDEEIKLIIEGRSKLMQNVCYSKPRPQHKIKRNAFFIDFEHSLLWCSVFKAASSSWLHKLVLLGGNGAGSLNKKHIIDIARELYPKPSKLQFYEAIHDPNITSLIIVREPFVRILSAYRDKLERRSLPYYRFISRLIIKKYRKKSDNIMPRERRPTFEEFVNYLIDPTTDVNELDEHWIPYSRYCTPCTIKYTKIAKVETLDRDNKYIVKKLGIEKFLSGQPPNNQANLANKSLDGQKTESLLKRYFGQLNVETLEKLIKVYADDFELFGYDKTPYYSYVKNKLY